MKGRFAAGLLALAVGHTIYGLNTLTLLTPTGRRAAGFFRLLIGGLLILACAINFWADVREWRAAQPMGIAPIHQADPETEAKADALGVDAHAIDGGPVFGRHVLIVYLCISGFGAILNVVGTLLVMILFMLGYLFTFNLAHPVSNQIYSLALPTFRYGLFKVLLNASLPVSPLVSETGSVLRTERLDAC
ncbi:MAG: tripartite tricarboxylate transporter TctB family protein [Pseudomonadota bacterium]